MLIWINNQHHFKYDLALIGCHRNDGKHWLPDDLDPYWGSDNNDDDDDDKEDNDD